MGGKREKPEDIVMKLRTSVSLLLDGHSLVCYVISNIGIMECNSYGEGQFC